MNDREAHDAIVELTDEVERLHQKLLDERKAHEGTLADLRSELAATRKARDEWERRAEDVLLEKLQGEAQLEYALARLVSPARAEIAEALADFWKAEAMRYRGVKKAGDVWGAVCIEDMATWHARRTTR